MEFNSLKSLRISSDAIQLYANHASRLASEVSQRLVLHPNLKEFLNGNPFRLIEINHRNHSAFMTEVLRTQNFDLLRLTLPWVYHTYRHQGIQDQYFVIQLKAWREALHAVLPDKIAAELTPIYDWLLAMHPEHLQAADGYQAERPPVPANLQMVYEQILEALLAGDHVTILHHCHALLETGLPFQHLLQAIFYPAMIEVGIRWEQGCLSVALEHQTTAMAYLILSTLYYEQPFPSLRRGKALVASVSNEFHELGAWMVTSCLELDGWDVIFLASDCDQEILVQRACKESPRFIALSITLHANLTAARATIKALRAALPEQPATPILVGGRSLLNTPSLVNSLGADLFLTDCEAAVSWARMLDPVSSKF